MKTKSWILKRGSICMKTMSTMKETMTMNRSNVCKMNNKKGVKKRNAKSVVFLFFVFCFLAKYCGTISHAVASTYRLTNAHTRARSHLHIIRIIVNQAIITTLIYSNNFPIKLANV